MNDAEQKCLALCRSKRIRGIPCMRDVPTSPMPDFWKRTGLRQGVDRFMVVDNNRFDSPILAAGQTWEEILPKLEALVHD
jgi:hypothetical protein